MNNHEALKEKIIIALINNLGIVNGRTRLQKILFLLENEENLDSHIKFEKWQYGPYSNEISRIIDSLKEKNVILETVNNTIRGESYFYIINPEKQPEVDVIIQDLDAEALVKINNVIAKFGNMPLNQLLRYVYSRYPSWTVSSIWRGKY